MKTITRLEPGHTAMIEYALKVADAIGIRYGMVHGEYMNEKTRESKHASRVCCYPRFCKSVIFA